MRKFLLFLLTVAIAVGVWYFAFVNSRFLAKPEAEHELSSDIRIGAVNVYGFRYLGDCRKAAELLLSTAISQDLDILVIQEFFTTSKLTKDDFIAIFSERFPYISIKGECAVASTLPVLDHRKVKFTDEPDYYSSALIDGGEGNGPFRILAVHLRTTGMYNYKNGAAVSNRDELKDMIGLMEGNGKIRLRQSQALQDVIGNTVEPLIVAGDFNALPLSKVYNNIKGERLADCFIEKGTGSGSTYRLLKDIFRIDYIFHDDAFSCVECTVADEYFSDHRLVTAALRKKSKE